MSDSEPSSPVPDGAPLSGSESMGMSRSRRRVRNALFAAIGVLYLLSVPWYRGDDSEVAIWLGLPDWVAVALLCYVAVAILNSIAWGISEIPEATPEIASGRDEAAQAASAPTGPRA